VASLCCRVLCCGWAAGVCGEKEDCELTVIEVGDPALAWRRHRAASAGASGTGGVCCCCCQQIAVQAPGSRDSTWSGMFAVHVHDLRGFASQHRH
jgi:hypothetical protein